jgi:hypothetical protein
MVRPSVFSFPQVLYWALFILPIESYAAVFVKTYEYALTCVLKSSPLVTDVQTYWFGLDSSMKMNLWTQVQDVAFWWAGSAVAWSYQNVITPANPNVTRTAVIKFVGPSPNTVTLVAITSQVPQSMPSRDYHSITGIASSTLPEAVFTLFM